MFSAIPEATTHGTGLPRKPNAPTWYFDLFAQKTRKNIWVFDAFSELLERHPSVDLVIFMIMEEMAMPVSFWQTMRQRLRADEKLVTLIRPENLERYLDDLFKDVLYEPEW